VSLVVFHRDFRGFFGGHLKVWDYFNHVRSSSRHEARIWFSPETTFGAGNPWAGDTYARPPADGETPDVLVLEGRDWLAVSEASLDRPVINLIQSPKHARPDGPRYTFLRNRAVRICVSPEVADAILGTGIVNGPVLTIPAAIDHSALPEAAPDEARSEEIVVLATKQPDLGRAVATRLSRRTRVVLVDAPVPRMDLLRLFARAQTAVLLPRRREGVYLPALEAMALRCSVVCPDCLGNRSFCRAGETCLQPSLTEDAVVAAAEDAFGLESVTRREVLDRAQAVARERDLPVERTAFLTVLDDLEALLDD
jgi:hypothetical protein